MKKLILCVLCASAALGAFAQKTTKPDDKKALAQYLWDNRWVACSTELSAANLQNGKALLPVSFSKTDIHFAEECNTCHDKIQFEGSKSRFRWVRDNYGAACTELKCLHDASAPDGLHGLYTHEYINYRRAGDQVIFTANNSEICLKPLPK